MKRFSFDGKAIAIILVLIVVFHAPVGSAIRSIFSYFANTSATSVGGALFWSIIANIASAAILLLIGFLFYRRRATYHLAGEYDAFEIVDGALSPSPIGTATIKVIVLGLDKHGTLVSLSLTGNDLNLSGMGHIIKDRYLIGHYSEPGNPTRRRCGAFTYELSGNGTEWEGDYSFVDPQQASITTGRARWKKK
jgi:hypothetical protein